MRVLKDKPPTIYFIRAECTAMDSRVRVTFIMSHDHLWSLENCLFGFFQQHESIDSLLRYSKIAYFMENYLFWRCSRVELAICAQFDTHWQFEANNVRLTRVWREMDIVDENILFAKKYFYLTRYSNGLFDVEKVYFCGGHCYVKWILVYLVKLKLSPPNNSVVFVVG